ncbi:MAG: lysophospholipid acyltransferase family protein [Paracoccaceae bacterium]|nr:lysophospholipid acyltransferase family protein [Paracoccaceae bacterium]
MSPTWHSDTPPPFEKITFAGWFRFALRVVPLLIVLSIGLALSLLLRLFERPVFGLARPITPFITVVVCRIALKIIGLRIDLIGQPMTGQGALVANHSSWLDIIVLNARKRVYFVSKSDVASWPGIGWLARATGTVFITRKRSKAGAQAALFRTRLQAGHKLLFFPEGTSSDGLQVLPFKSSLFAAFFTPELRDVLSLQPVSVTYHAPPGMDRRFYGWWGNMDFGPHILKVLASSRQGHVSINYHPPLKARDYDERKSLSQTCEAQVRAGHSDNQQDR